MKDTMKAVKIIKPGRLEVVETDTPEPNGENVIVKVLYSGICGTDLGLWSSGAGDGALTPGHEYVGIVEDPGVRDDLKKGDRVTSIPWNPCNECNTCTSGYTNLCPNAMTRGVPGVTANGSFADYFSAIPGLVIKFPDSISDLQAALVEPAAVGCRAAKLAKINSGDKVLVVGAGIIGLFCAAWARINGAGYIAMSEVNDFRGANAVETGVADELFDAKDPDVVGKLIETTKGGFDCVFEASGIEAGINTSLMALKPTGMLLLAGVSHGPVSLEMSLAVVKELEIKSSLGSLPEDINMTIDKIADGSLQVEKFISDILGLNDAQKAFERSASVTGTDVKILIKS
ncbi:MAG: alcohol dehydrogenase catalytic domain-containing protein [Desulfobacterales bacterium]|jgi:2-desacetyl-2-hydroxyethyl bacteriochlorophyllide A dehydrogenase|nr:alcohol dehydrogenase catalytic domain-containing protein [Desulfobacterales bacterium]